MALWLQHTVVFAIVTGAAAFIGWQALRSAWGKSSRIGSCCSSRCGEQSAADKTKDRVVFLPVERLTRKR